VNLQQKVIPWEFVVKTTVAVEVLCCENNIVVVAVLWLGIDTGVTGVLSSESNNTAFTRENNPDADGVLWREKNTSAFEIF